MRPRTSSPGSTARYCLPDAGPAVRKLTKREGDLAGRHLTLRKNGIELAADHHADQIGTREVARVANGHKVNPNVYAMIVPGSGIVKEQAEAEGLDKIFKAAGFDWREPGCPMCLAMNPDKLKPGERCASTSNRNFEGRQGYKGRTHLVSPAMAAAAAIAGKFVDVREWK